MRDGIVLGLDLGISSIGFALVDFNNNKVVNMGVHVFDKAEQPKTGASLALPRREARSARRIVKRRKMRKQNLLNFLNKQNFKNTDLVTNNNSSSPWELRAKGVKHELSDLEFARCIYHICNRRGFKSNRKDSNAKDNDQTIMKKAINELEAEYARSGYSTIGEYLNSLDKKRNSSGKYEHTIKRDWVIDEARKIIAKQREFNPNKYSESFEEEIVKIISFQRPLKSAEEMVGYCTFFTNEKRAAKFSFSAEEFVFYSKLNNIKIKDDVGKERLLSKDERQAIIDLAFKNKEVTYTQIRKAIKLTEDCRFNFVRYSSKKKPVKELDEKDDKLSDFEKEKFFSFKGYNEIKKAFDEHLDLWDQVKNDNNTLDEIARILSFEFDDQKIESQLEQITIIKNNKDLIDKLIGINDFSKTINLSIKALKIINPLLKEGLNYYDAVKKLIIDGTLPEKKKNNLLKLPAFEKTNNPVVDRAIAQARKIINQFLANKDIKPNIINIELAREIGKSYKIRQEITKNQKNNKEYNDKLRAEFKEEFKLDCKGDMLTKYKLYKQQAHTCPYSGRKITAYDFLDNNKTQIDHILPIKRSFDDSFNNKVLVFAEFNQEKGDKTPFEKWGDTKQWEIIESCAKLLPRNVKEKILIRDYDEKKEADWKERHLNDTKYMSRYLKEVLKSNLGEAIKVNSVSGGITSYLRRNWGLGLKDREDNRHHAIDAVIVACSNMSIVQKVTNYHKYNKEMPYCPLPWEKGQDGLDFREEVKENYNEVFVSRLPNRVISGEIHKATVKSYRPNNPEGERIIKRIPLNNVSLDLLDKMVDLNRNKKLYNTLKERLDFHIDNPKNAFKEPIYMPKNNGEKGPIITGIRIYDDSKSGMEVRGGFADNGEMVRVDVFSRKDKKGLDKFYLVPIYVKDAVSRILPMKTTKNEEIDDTYKFKFSLYKNDYAELTDNKGVVTEGYYLFCDISTAVIALLKHNLSKQENMERKAVLNLKSFKKFHVNYFGKKFEVKNEKRIGF